MGKVAFMLVVVLALFHLADAPAFAAAQCAYKYRAGATLYVSENTPAKYKGVDTNLGTTKEHPLKTRGMAKTCLSPNGGSYYLLNSNGDEVPPAKIVPRPGSGRNGVPLPTPVLYSLLAVGVLLLFSSGWLLQRRGQRLAQQP